MQRVVSSIGAVAALFAVSFAAGCASDPEPEPGPPPPHIVDGQPVYEEGTPEFDSGPRYYESEWRIYTVFKPVVTRVDWQGVFIIPQGRIVGDFWRAKYVELTRANHHADFFREFFEYMALGADKLRKDWDRRRANAILRGLEADFRLFCKGKGIEEQFLEYKRDQEEVYARQLEQ